jgi:hypothetical protein
MKSLNLRQFLESHWKPLALYGGLFAILAIALVWQIGSLLPGYASDEAASYQLSNNFHAMFDNPLNTPYYLVVKAISYVPIIPANDLVITRLASVLFGAGTLVLFAILVRRWHDQRTAVVGTLLFGMSAWFLHTSRFGAPEVLLFGVFALIACGYWLKHVGSNFAVLCSVVLVTLMLYVPGMVWFVALGVMWQWKTIDRVFKKHSLTMPLAGLAFLGALVPLGWALYKNHALIKPWLGLPQDWPTPLEMVRNLLEVPFNLFIRGDADPVTWLGTAPVLEVFSLSMFVLGIFLYLRHWKLGRTSLFIAIFVLMTALMTIGGAISLTVAMPFVYLIITAGASYLIEQWFKVFPRNPIARTIGIAMMGAVIGLVCIYHITHYFVGWPHAQATHEAYTIQRDCVQPSCLSTSATIKE